MRLRFSPASPFVRKVRIAADIAGLTDKIELVSANTMEPDDALLEQNPLGKIPVLILDDGSKIYDSLTICEYLDHHAGGTTLFPTDDTRWAVLTLHSLATGIMDATLLQVYEGRFRPEEKQHEPWLARQKAKVDRGLAQLEANPPNLDTDLTIGHVAVACALSYLDLRFEGTWRSDHPKLVEWLDAFADQVPAFETTKPEV